MDERIISLIEARLREYGLEIAASREPLGLDGEQVWDATVTRHGDPSWRWHVSAASLDPMTLSELRSSGWAESLPLEPLLIGPRVTERSASEFRRLGLSYIDAGGNASLRHEGVLIDVRGRGPDKTVPPSQAGRSGVNLFSTRRSQVVFALLSWPESWTLSRRTLAKIAGVSTGLVSEVLEMLEASEVHPDDVQRGRKVRETLIDQWVAAFPTGLGSTRYARQFSTIDFDVRPLPGVEMYRSGESASQWLRPQGLSLWVRPWMSEIALENRWRRSSSSNVTVREVFWTSPRPNLGGIQDAPPLLIYAELLALRDSRSREAADRLRAETGLLVGQ